MCRVRHLRDRYVFLQRGYIFACRRRAAASMPVLLPEKDRNELIHPGVREQQIRGVRQKRRRRHNGVLFLAKEIDK